MNQTHEISACVYLPPFLNCIVMKIRLKLLFFTGCDGQGRFTVFARIMPNVHR